MRLHSAILWRRARILPVLRARLAISPRRLIVVLRSTLLRSCRLRPRRLRPRRGIVRLRGTLVAEERLLLPPAAHSHWYTQHQGRSSPSCAAERSRVC